MYLRSFSFETPSLVECREQSLLYHSLRIRFEMNNVTVPDQMIASLTTEAFHFELGKIFINLDRVLQVHKFLLIIGFFEIRNHLEIHSANGGRTRASL